MTQNSYRMASIALLAFVATAIIVAIVFYIRRVEKRKSLERFLKASEVLPSNEYVLDGMFLVPANQKRVVVSEGTDMFVYANT